MIYKRNYLREVILRADFNNPSLKIDSAALQAFKEKLGISDIELKENEIKSVELKLSQSDPTFNLHSVGRNGTFLIDGGIRKFILDPLSFTLSVNSYTNFKEFFDLFSLGFKTLLELDQIKEFRRLGLRYVNVFRKLENVNTITDWSNLINPFYITSYEKFLTPVDSFSIRRNMNKIILSNGEYILSLNIGLWNDNFPGKLIDQDFVIDIDCYIDNLILDSEEILKRPIFMNDINTNFFNTIITQNLKDILGT